MIERKFTLRVLKKVIILLSMIVLIFADPFIIAAFHLNVTAASYKPHMEEGFILAVENNELALYHNLGTYSVAVADKTSGDVWYSYLPENEIPEGEISGEIMNEITSLFTMDYSQINITTDKVTNSNINKLKPEAAVRKIAQGFAYDLYFKNLNLRMSAEFSIEENRMTVRIPKDRILEGVGTDKQLEDQKALLTAFIEKMRDYENLMRNDAQVPDSYKKNLNKLSAEIRNFETNLGMIRNVIRIETSAEQLTAFIKKMKDILLSGDTLSPGVITAIRLGEEIPDDVKLRYSSLLLEIRDEFDAAELFVAGLKSINVASIVELNVLPNFGSSGDNADGYMFYPDGSGAITYFKENHPEFSGAYKRDIYASDTPDPDSESLINETGLTGTMLPVIGVKKGSSAFTAVAVKGDEECYAAFYPSGYIVDVNRVNMGFRYRRKITGGSKMGSFNSSANYQYEADMRDIEPELVYIFLSGENADYSGMAVSVREIYKENKTLGTSRMLSGDLQLMALSILCGINRKQLIFDNYLKFTTYHQAAEIINDIYRNSNVRLMVDMRGWKPAPSLDADTIRAYGGKNGMKILAQMADRCDTGLFLNHDPYRVMPAMSGYKDGDLAIANNLLIIQSKLTGRSVLSPEIMVEKFLKALYSISKNGVNGISLTGAGSFVYYDYNTNRTATRADSISYWKTALGKAREELGNTSVSGGNKYILDSVDWLQEIPDVSSGFSYTDESVPFYQIVVHGSIPYSGKAVNAFYDPQKEKLRAIEYGYAPMYSVTYEPAEYDSGFSSGYSDVREGMLELFKEYENELHGFAKNKIMKHEVTGEQVKVTYGDGSVIYLNYAASEAAIDGMTIKPLDYLVVSGERGDLPEKGEIPEYEAPGGSDGRFVYAAVAGGILALLLVSALLFTKAYIRKSNRQKNI